jgi:hypothetical protein
MVLKMPSLRLFEKRKDVTVGIGSEMRYCMLADTRLIDIRNSFPHVKA